MKKIRYADVYSVVKSLRGENAKVTEERSEFDAFISTLEEMKKEAKSSNFHFGGTYKEGKLTEIDYVVVQNEAMYLNSQNFSDLIYIDISNGTNKHDMGLILFSGINHERQSIVLAYALIREDIYSNYYNIFGTFFNKFNKENPTRTIITDINFEMEKALTSILTGNTIHLFCQWHVKRYIKDRFYKMNTKNATPPEKLLYDVLIS